MLSYNLSLCLDTPLNKTEPGARRKEVFKRGEAPLLNILPLPYQGRGIKGEGYLNKNFKRRAKIRD